MSAELPSKPIDETTELARERNRIAADRTLLAWIRLSLTLIGIGFGVDQSIYLLHREIGDVINPYRLSHILGLLLIGLGVYALIVAAIDYRGEMHRLKQPEYRFTPRYQLGETIGMALVAIAGLTFGTILWRLWT
jgi:putative membrane protein